MELQPSFLIYNASAGSGKTFSLVKEYLKKVFESEHDSYYQHLLAITFTNKAVAEMKQRIVETLIQFSEVGSDINPNPMMIQISDETGIDLKEIQNRSKKILRHLLHHYGAFSVETIDRFNHRLIRTFARDLKLSQNFEVTLDIDLLLQEAVDLLLSKTGEDAKITSILLDFALEKADDDKSWDIARDIVQTSKLIYKENISDHVLLLKGKSIEDFSRFKLKLLRKRNELASEITEIATQTLSAISDKGLEETDFNRRYLPNHFKNLSQGNFGVSFNLKWQETLGEQPLYPKRVSSAIGDIIDSLVPLFTTNFHETKNRIHLLLLIENILKNLTPLSVINLVIREIENIKNDQNILPISEFNLLINKEIKNQPAPFIYERLGEKYRHFFIDEFQDTSKMQWQNLLPLIDNALAQSTHGISGSLLLVGDAKQSIYRWRGGLPEQFMELYNKENPFASRGKEVLTLDTNYRSHEEIINFNNQFFTFISKFFAKIEHQDLYLLGNKQFFNAKKEGYVKLEFIESQIKSINLEVYSEKVLHTILEVIEKGYAPNDICILTRKKADGIFLGSYLMEHGISIISSESLLLQSSTKVQILILTMKIVLNPNNEEARIFLLDLLHDHWKISEEKHDFFIKFLGGSEEDLQITLGGYGIDFDPTHFRGLPLYEAFEYAIRAFALVQSADAYLFGFMDFVFEFGSQSIADKGQFLDYWETKKNAASIPASEGANAVQLMTIHKSKGLEFPVVIFPFSDIKLYDARYDTLWYPLDKDEFEFSEAFINFKEEVKDYGPIGEKLYLEHRSKLELDNLNLLYVTLTRAIEKLYIFAEMPSEPKDGIPSNYNQLFLEFLKDRNLWNVDQYSYEFGENTGKTIEKTDAFFQTNPRFISTDPSEHGLHLVSNDSSFVEFERAHAIMEGTLFHETMSKIKIQSDFILVMENLQKRSLLLEEDFKTLKDKIQLIIEHPDLKSLFMGTDSVYCEREIITSTGEIIRPDRINFHVEGSATLIDYKTGIPQPWHSEQVVYYAGSLEEMGYSIKNIFVVYSGSELNVLKIKTS